MYAARTCAANDARSACSAFWLRVSSARNSVSAPLRAELRRVQLIEPLALRGHRQFRLAQARTQGVALLELRARCGSVSAAIRARTAASFAFASACAESAGCSGGRRCRRRAARAARRMHRALKRLIHGRVFIARLSIQALCPLLYLRARKTRIVRRMQRLFEFIGHHPYLAAATLLAADRRGRLSSCARGCRRLRHSARRKPCGS